MKVTEFSRKGSGWEGLNTELGGGLAETRVTSEALWVILCGTAGEDLKESVWLSDRVLATS